MYEHAPCGYLSTTADGTIVKINQTFLSWTGHHRDDVLGRRFPDLLTAGGRIYHETHYAPLLRMQGNVREIALDVVRADGTRLPVLVNSALKADESGEPVVVRIALFDATDRREYERELLRALARAEESEARATELAATLQASLIPPAPPAIPGLDVGAVYRPAGRGDEVGGDFYDVFETGRGEWAVFVGDVCGKGIEAAAVTALARYTLRAAAVRTRRPKLILSLLNDAVLRERTERFCTVIYGRLRIGSGSARVTLASGGHPLPVVVSRDGPAVVAGRPGDLVGVLESFGAPEWTVALVSGDALVLYTDGVTEARGRTGFFGTERLLAVASQHAGRPATELANAIVDTVVAFQDGLPRDDIAVVVVAIP
ncbi:MAG TPA: SpoIIE family protein phosphatase [Acidimicrobiales bacterium]